MVTLIKAAIATAIVHHVNKKVLSEASFIIMRVQISDTVLPDI